MEMPELRHLPSCADNPTIFLGGPPGDVRKTLLNLIASLPSDAHVAIPFPRVTLFGLIPSFGYRSGLRRTSFLPSHAPLADHPECRNLVPAKAIGFYEERQIEPKRLNDPARF